MHKLLLMWTKQNQPSGETLTKDPTHQLLIKRQDQLSPFFLALLIGREWMWISIRSGSQLQFTLGCPLVSGVDSRHCQVGKRNWLPRWATAGSGGSRCADSHYLCKACSFSVRSLARASTNQMSLAGLVLTAEPRNIPLTSFRRQGKSFITCCCSGQTQRRAGAVV